MEITIAIDSFKGSLSTLEAARAAAEGIKRVYGDAKINISPSIGNNFIIPGSLSGIFSPMSYI